MIQQEDLEARAWAERAATCALTNLRKASRAATQYFDGALEPSGLRSTQFVLLVNLAALQPVSVARLARELVMDPSTLARNLRPLQAKALVGRSRGGTGRRTLLSLTGDGRDVLAAALPLWQQAQAQFVRQMGEARWATLRTGLLDTVLATRGAGLEA